MNIKDAINEFLLGRGSDKRNASFDYCYNYFYSFKNNPSDLANKENMYMSCLQIGFYLASWGMMRGSLIEKSVRYYKKLIKVISDMDSKLWEIDVDNYNDENISMLIDCGEKIASALRIDKEPTDTQITKIMLGVFANTPAFDQNVSNSFHFYKFRKESLLKISKFYNDHKKYFDSFNIKTLDFVSGNETNIVYTKAKLVDMYGFIDGQKK